MEPAQSLLLLLIRDGRRAYDAGVSFRAIGEKTFLALRDEGKEPEEWSGGISGQGIRTFSPEGYAAWVEKGRPWVPEIRPDSWLADEFFITPAVLDAALAGEIKPRTKDSLRDPVKGLRDDASDTLVIEPRTDAAVDVTPYIRGEWGCSWDEAGAGWFRETTMVELAKVVPEGGTAADVRLLFFFDN